VLNLAEDERIGLPLFARIYDHDRVCTYFSENKRNYPRVSNAEVEAGSAKVKKRVGKSSVTKKALPFRSALARAFHAGNDGHILLGMNDSVVEIVGRMTNNARFAWDSYRRFCKCMAMFVMGRAEARGEDHDHSRA